MVLDPSRLQKTLEETQKSREDKAYGRTGKVTDSFFYRVTMDENSPEAYAVEMLLGIKPGGIDKVKEVLGLEGDMPAEPAALSGPNRGILPAYGADGSPLGTGFGLSPEERARAHQAGYTEKLGNDGSVEGWMPLAPATTPTPSPATPAMVADLDREVPIRDKKGRDTRQRISVREGNADPGLEAILNDTDGTVVAFQEKPRVAVRRS